MDVTLGQKKSSVWRTDVEASSKAGSKSRKQHWVLAKEAGIRVVRCVA